MLAARIMSALKARPLSEIRDYAVILVRNAVGLPNRMRTADRDTLEQVIIPAYAARSDIAHVLFVGCAWYTRHYEKMFLGCAYTTIDPDPWKRRFGARRHIVAGLESLAAHVGAGSLDLVVCNGVFGWGLDDRADCERAFAACFDALRPGGELVIGWNDVAPHRPLDLATLASLARFEPLCFAPLAVTRYLANPGNGHVYDFYVKP
jgi:SAM-dependent methyltransferase